MIISPPGHIKRHPLLDRSVSSLKGIGTRRAVSLSRRGIHTLLDLLYMIPSRYEDRTRILTIAESTDGEQALIRGGVIRAGEERFHKTGKRLFRIVVQDRTGRMELLWFNYKKPALSSFARKGVDLLAYGRVQERQQRRQMIHPDVSLVTGPPGAEAGLGYRPLYPALEGITWKVLRNAIMEAMDRCLGVMEEGIPPEVTGDLRLPSVAEAIRNLHDPPGDASIEELNGSRTPWHRRLVFDRFFEVMLNIAFRKRYRQGRQGHVFSISPDLMARIEGFFPFSFTPGQKRALEEIFKDFQKGRPMNRLLQGDVGCGKTVVAAAAASAAIQNGWQVALMVPTHVLAEQHYRFFLEQDRAMGFRPALLKGGLRRSERMELYEAVSRGSYNVIIGTQALIQEGLSFSKLGLVVIDEQHRFGVRQRALLDRKGVNPHLLVMTATPIPRTLAMTVYGDLDISVIREYPEGRVPVATRIMDRSRKREVYEIIKERMRAGRQAMVICPVVESTEDADIKNAVEMYAALEKLYGAAFRVGLVHGRLDPGEKERVMRAFRNGEIDLLVGTTVVEVGVHAPKATVMVIEHPERFGLSQLHQLRGRVGRGEDQGLCILMRPERL